MGHEKIRDHLGSVDSKMISNGSSKIQWILLTQINLTLWMSIRFMIFMSSNDRTRSSMKVTFVVKTSWRPHQRDTGKRHGYAAGRPAGESSSRHEPFWTSRFLCYKKSHGAPSLHEKPNNNRFPIQKEWLYSVRFPNASQQVTSTWEAKLSPYQRRKEPVRKL